MARAAWGQTSNPLAALPAAPASAATASLASAAPAEAASSDAISINIDGRVIEANPAPVLRNGAVFVPLRGVLENLGAKLTYDAKDRGIDIVGNGRRVTLRVGQQTALIDLRIVPLSAAPLSIGGSAFVPLRALAEIFGYRVNWIAASRTVAVYSRETVVRNTTNHREALGAAGRFGINIDFTDASADEVGSLLDSAKAAGAGLIRTRFDWNTLQPVKGGPFQWAHYDRVVREARSRGLVVTGVLGDSAHWASVYSRTNDPFLKTYGPPRETEIPAWRNYVRRTVGRYANDVHQWQIWDRASSNNFRSGQRVYFQMLELGAQEARAADPKAILIAGEPGGADLGWTELLAALPVGRMLDGVASYPASGWQPGRTANPEEFVLPYAALRQRYGARGKSALPVGALSFPVLRAVGSQVPGTTNADAARIKSLLATYTPDAQADYLMRSMVLAYVQNAPQIFWGALRDDAKYESIEPVNPEVGSGLLERDMTPRASYAAYQNTVKQLAGHTYIGAYASGPNVVALVFEKGIEANIALWSPTGNAQVVLNSQGQDPQLPDTLLIPTRADAKVLDASGTVIGNADGVLQLGTRPVWVTQAAISTSDAARKNGTKLRLVSPPEAWTEATGVRADFGAANGGEQGIAWRKYMDYRAVATNFSKDAEFPGILTEMASDPLRPGDGHFFVFMDIDDDYMFFERGVPVDVTVTVRRLSPEIGAIVPHEGGFNLEYESATGVKSTKWQVVEEGTGWQTYTYRLPDASFANRGGYDLVLNTFGSKRQLTFGSITVKKATA